MFSVKLLSFILMLHLGAFPQPIKKGVFKFNEETHNFGRIPKGKPVTFVFAFSNIGERPIVIFEVEPICGCTIADYTKSPVKKDQKGYIKVTFNALTVQQFNKAIVINSNSNSPTKSLTIKGEVVNEK